MSIEPKKTETPSEALTASSSPTNGFLANLGPGLVTGAADDDPSGIATYSQVGAHGMASPGLSCSAFR